MIALVLFACVGAALAQADEIAAALARVPPLKVLSFTPAEQRNSEFTLRNSEAITVVFNRAVVALGSTWGGPLSGSELPLLGLPANVPGKARWVTTAILRFDPDVAWPTDLAFALRIDPQLRTFDGSTLAEPATARFRTEPLGWSLRGVASAAAAARTAGRWSARRNAEYRADAASDVEVPADGRVSIDFARGAARAPGGGGFREFGGGGGFASPVFGGYYGASGAVNVSAALVAQSLRLRDASGASVAVSGGVKACRYGGESCISFEPPSELERGQRYELVLPKGARYHERSGPLANELVVPLFGLFPFEFPFVSTEVSGGNGLTARRWRLYLRHGLDESVACDETACEPIRQLLTVQDARGVNLELELKRVEKAVLELYVAAASPDETYTLNVQASSAVLDGFGQPLQAGRTQLLMAGVSNMQANWRSGSVLNVERDFDADVALVHRRQGAKRITRTSPRVRCERTWRSISGWNVDSPTMVTRLLEREARVANTSANAHELLVDSADGAQMTALPTASLWGSTNTFFWQAYGYDYDCEWKPLEQQFVSRADLAVSLIGWSATGDALALVTRPSTNAVVAGAKVTAYVTRYDTTPQVRVGVSATTDADGLARLVFQSSSANRYMSSMGEVSVEKDGEILVTNTGVRVVSQSFRRELAQARTTATTDRNLYKEGETVAIKGYTRYFDNNGVLLPATPAAGEPRSAGTQRVYALVQWERDNQESMTLTQLGKVNEFGAFTGELVVPQSVSYGVLSAQLFEGEPQLTSRTVRGRTYVSIEGKAQPLTVVPINIADPRVPTGILDIETDAKVYAPPTRVGAPADAAPGVTIRIDTRTYTGAPMPGSKVTLAWTLEPAAPSYDYFFGLGALLRGGGNAERKTLTGEREVVTDDDGALEYAFKLTDDELEGMALEEGQTLRIDARMIGATRELLEDSLSLPVRSSPYQIRLQTSAGGEPVPGLRFALFVDVRDADDAPVRDVAVAIKLVEASDDEARALASGGASLLDESTGRLRQLANSGDAQRCDAKSDEGRALQCTTLVLSQPRRYVLRASAIDADGNAAETVLPLGRTADEWKARPVSALPTPTMVVDRSSYAVGDSVKLSFMNPFDGASRLLLRWGNVLAAEHAVLELSGEGETTVTLPKRLGDECRTGCQLSAVLLAGQSSTRTLPAGVPQSTLFDLSQAQGLTISNVRIAVDTSGQHALGDVTVSSDATDATTSPGSRVEFTVDVRDENGQPLADGEAHLFVVDRKILDLAPHAVLRAADQFDIGLDAYFGVDDSRSAVLAQAIYEASRDRTLRRAQALPWWSARTFMEFAELSDEEFMARYARFITYVSSGGCTTCDASEKKFDGPITSTAAFPTRAPSAPDADFGDDAGFAQPEAAPGGRAGGAEEEGGAGNRQLASADSAASIGGNAGASTTAPELRTEPVWTPLSATARVKDGKATFVLERMPDNLGVFRVAALVTDGKRFGNGETEITSRKRFNVEASLPRIVRVGDRFVGGVTVSSNLKASEYPVTLYGAVSVPCAFVGLLDKTASKEIKLTKPGPVRVEWGFEATGLTDGGVLGAGAALYFSLVDGKSFKRLDQLRARVPVLAQQDEVSVADSFAVEATEDGQARNTGIEIPEHVDHSATVHVEAGVGRLPSIMFYASQLLDASEMTTRTVSANALVGGVAPMWLLDGPYEKAVPAPMARRMNAAFARATRRLAALTLNDQLGLVNYVPRAYRPERPDVSLNLYALYVTGKLSKSDQERFPRSSWTNAVHFGLDRMAVEARERLTPSTFQSFELLVDVFDTFGFDFKVQSQFADDFTPARLLDNTQRMSSAGAARLAAALQTHASSIPSSAKAKADSVLADILENLGNKMRVQGRTAYVARTSGSKYADYGASYVGLRALADASASKLERIEEPKVLVEKLANWVAAPREDESNRWYSPGGRALVTAAHALSVYDETRGNDEPNFEVRVASGDFDLLRDADGFAGARFTDAGQPPVSNSTNAWLLPPVGGARKKDPIAVFVKGTQGEASVVLGIDFVPCERERNADGKLVGSRRCAVSDEPVYRGISVEKIIRPYDATTGEALPSGGITDAPSGSQVEVTIQVTTPDDLHNVEVVDWLAGGLEALEYAEPSFNNNPWAYGWWAWSAFPFKEVRKDRVTAFAYYLSAGTHSFTYTALVVSPGVFALPPTKAFAQDQPELLGLSAGGQWGSTEAGWDDVLDGRTSDVCLRDPVLILDASGEKVAELDPPSVDDGDFTELPTFKPAPTREPVSATNDDDDDSGNAVSSASVRNALGCLLALVAVRVA